MDTTLMLDYVERVVLPHCRTANKTLLILDSFAAHKTDEVNELLRVNNINCLFIPPRTTSYLQPLDVSINAPFKERVRSKYEEWIQSDHIELTPKGNIKRASYGTVVGWVKHGLDGITAQSVISSFEACGISSQRNRNNFNHRLATKLDGSSYTDPPVQAEDIDWEDGNGNSSEIRGAANSEACEAEITETHDNNGVDLNYFEFDESFDEGFNLFLEEEIEVLNESDEDSD
jgi:hypothetical protein